jgi:hypothetical protein
MTHANPVRATQSQLQADVLSPAERLLLWSMRAWATLRQEGDRPEPVVGAALGARASPRAVALFGAWMQAVEASARGRIQIHSAACAALGQDEARLLIACGLAPVDTEAGERLLRPLLADPEPAMALARALNRVLAADGWSLPARFNCAISDVRPSSRTIH